MGQIFLPENIPSITRTSGTVITLPATSNAQPTRFNIGGQQFALSAAITMNSAINGTGGLDTGALVAATIYYVYAVVHQTTFLPSLVASLAASSVGPSMPSGYGTAYKFVGEFYTDGSAAIASVLSGSAGEKVTGVVNAIAPTTTIADASTSILLGVGNWMVHYYVAGYVNSPVSTNSLTYVDVSLTDAANNAVTEGQSRGITGGFTASTSIRGGGPWVKQVPIYVSTPTSYKLRAQRFDDTGGAGSAQLTGGPQSSFFAVRI
jgi:hypothetical protein